MDADLQAQLIPPLEPAPILWWPPAPGWWLLGGSLLLLALLLPWLLRQARRHKRRRHRLSWQVLADIPTQLPDTQWLAAVNTRLKQLLKQRGDEAATRLYGEAWLDYLCSRNPQVQRSALQPLAADLYRPQVQLSAAQREALLRELRRWIRYDDV
ncbi:DUF4381 family protein [Pseudomonas sp. MYb185]|uniref:DUF4381 family protein n=1 Tax=Pseudomonas sp. MYb185 TaxID=1848729 RepID=UPI000CFA8BAE|nr:DUF4381 family protein [Pseudomonas sp. MYb185]PRB81347.1 hypothetical protein CQ007_09320 [Pseudomonas sp. MYb185]